MALAALAVRIREPGNASPTGVVRMSAPFPAALSVRAENSSAASCRRSETSPRPASAAWASTARVCVPTSDAPPASQSRKRSPTRSRAGSLVSDTPLAATLAMHIAIWVSSDHSPGS